MANTGSNILGIIFIILIVALAGHGNLQAPSIDTSVFTQSKTLGECQTCKIFVGSFKMGLDRTTRGKFEGGDAAWEEEKLKISYKRSEMRLIDIQEGLCKELSDYSAQCHHMAEKAEDFIEEWWSQDPDNSDDLFTYICIEKLKLCCPKKHYGKNCLPCIGNHDNLCSGNGKCRGDGTRKGNGTCMCDMGYGGDNCEECAVGFYAFYLDEEKFVCSGCHVSCMGGCRQGSQKDCVACKPGYVFDPEEGCTDINECEEANKCTKEQFCMNSIGSFMCVDCDKSCDGCHGDGLDMCRKCAKGYSKKGDLCISDREDEDQSDALTTTRKEEL